jgi:hypothetical protein
MSLRLEVLVKEPNLLITATNCPERKPPQPLLHMMYRQGYSIAFAEDFEGRLRPQGLKARLLLDEGYPKES